MSDSLTIGKYSSPLPAVEAHWAIEPQVMAQNAPGKESERRIGLDTEPYLAGPSEDPCLSPEELDALWQSHDEQFQRTGDLGDLDKSIEYGTSALYLTPEGHPGMAQRHANLGKSYNDRFQCLGNMADLDKAVDHDNLALALTPDGHPDSPRRHDNLGISYNDRFGRLGNLHDIQKCVEHFSCALELTPEGHPDLTDRHANLGLAYTDRFRRLGGLEDNDKSIEHFSHALELTPEGHSDMGTRYASLGMSYTDRFQRLGDLKDLQKSIEHFSRALELTPEGHPNLATRHADVGVTYSDRFRRLGDINDLQKCIEHFSYALKMTPEDHPILAARHADLGMSYSDRFQHLGDLNDLQKSIEHGIHALALTPQGHPDLATRHASLAVCYSNRFRRLGDLNELQKEIEHDSRALELTPESHPDLARRHASLGASYTDRYERLGDPHDLELIVKHESRALALTLDDHPDIPQRHFNLALTLYLQYEHTDDASYLTRSHDSFRAASQIAIGSPRDKFTYALDWAKRASKYPILGSIESYQTAIDLLPQFIWLGASTNQRYYDLLSAGNLAVNAASAAIRHSNPSLALEWLEHARCVVWNQTLMLRSPLDELESSHPDLASRLRAVSKQLHDPSSESAASQACTSAFANPEGVAHDRRRLAKEYEDLVSQVRKLPTFETFLQPSGSDHLVRAARNGPIIVINCHDEYCDALVILPGCVKVKHLCLPNFSQEKAQKARSELESSLRHRGVRDRGVKVLEQPEYKDTIDCMLLTLWNDVVKPVLEFLGYMDNDSAENLPHITWCPTGALSFLPLHAAGDYDQPRSRVYNYAISSYTPTLTALLASASSNSSGTPRLLAIGQSNTPGHTPLPGTTTELAYIQSHAQNKFEYSQLINNQATTTTVLDAMEQHDWVHLACHAHQNVTDPAKSGFFLHEGTLDLASINRRSFKNKGLAFLSACQTATGDEKLPDEAVHLASGVLIAGYPSVIATMWSVHDEDAPLIADKVYAELMKDGKVGNGEAGRALHDAVEVLRNEIGEKAFARWVPYIHIGS